MQTLRTLAAVVAVVAFHSMAYAVEHVTMAFEATVTNLFPPTSVSSTPPIVSTLSLGFDVKAGDVISGEFTFTPYQFTDAPPYTEFASDQPNRLSVVVAGVRFASNPYRATVQNDASFIFDSVTDVPTGPYDRIALISKDLSVDSPSVAAAINSRSSQLRVDLWGLDYHSRFGIGQPILDTPGFPSDPTRWNALRYLRRVVLSLGPATTTPAFEGIQIEANIGDLRLVPEPSSAVAAAAAATCTGLCRRRPRR
ncbi:MAG: hypothetical protein ACRCT8_01090 [Lacipirellulaceae bacterium]